MKADSIRILIIDDSEDVLNDLKKALPPEVNVTDERKVPLEVCVLEVKFEGTHGTFQIHQDTLAELSNHCYRSFDFIFTDYAFIADRNKNEELRQKLMKEKRHPESNDTKGWLLHISDILERAKQLDNNHFHLPFVPGLVRTNFVEHAGEIFYYTYSPEPFASFFEEPEATARVNELERAFPHATVGKPILLHQEFKIYPGVNELIAGFDQSARKRFIAALVGTKMRSIIEAVVFRDIIFSQRRLRYQNAQAGYQTLVALGLVIGAFSAIFGEMLFHFLREPMTALMALLGIDLHASPLAGLLLVPVLLYVIYKLIGWLALRIARSTESLAEALSGSGNKEHGA